MASRAAQKQQARERRVAEQQAQAERERRERRLRMAGGTILLAVAVVGVAIAISAGGASAPKTTGRAANAAASTVDTLLAGIPQSGNTLGSPSAKVTITEFGDLKCPVCADFALGPENQIIANDVRSGKAKLVYRSLCTATCSSDSPQPGVFPTQQAAAEAAGLQGKEWYYVELFYHLQGDETTSYVDASYLNGLAKLVPGLNYTEWARDAGQSSLKAQVASDQAYAKSQNYWGQPGPSTPTVLIKGPKGQAQPMVGGPYAYSDYESAINSVS